jgi:uncharacterized cupredoxin-like copper-binding protein
VNPSKYITKNIYKTPTTKLVMILMMISLSFIVGASGSHGGGQHKGKSKIRKQKMVSKYDYNKSVSLKSNNTDSVVGRASDSAMTSRLEYVFLSDNMQMTLEGKLNIQDDEIINFVVVNKGKIPHEFFIGDDEEQKKHLGIMKTVISPIDDKSNFITVQPGETRELTWRFKGGSHVVFACNMPGHFEAGMFQKAVVDVR